MGTVLTEQHDGVMVVTINRPEASNAVDRATARALADVFRAFDTNAALRVAILTGAGGTFCAGADLKSFADGHGNALDENGDGPMGPTRMLLSKPVIAAVEGHAVAGGLELAIWCDLRVAARNAVFGVFCRRFGVPLIDLGTVRLPRLIGQSRALDLILTGRAVSGEEALGMGLANRLVEAGQALPAALDLANNLAVLPQTCMRSDRLSCYQQWALDWESAQRNEFRRGMQVIDSGESVAGARRFASGQGRVAMLFRNSDESDAEAITELINSAFRIERFFLDNDRISLDQVRHLFTTGEFLVCEDADAILCCCYVELRGDRAYLGLLSVNPRHQRAGLGKRMMAEAEQRCRERGCHCMDIQIVNIRQELPQFYRPLGYTETGTAPFPSNIVTKLPCHFVTMSKDLTR